MIFRGMEIAKRFFGEVIFNQMITYLRNDSVRNLPRVFDLACKAPINSEHRMKIKRLKHAYENNPAIRQYITRLLTEVDENVLLRSMTNLIINAGLIGVPRQRHYAEKSGHGVPFTMLIDPTEKCNLNCLGCWAGAYEKHNELSFEEMDRIIQEGKELGIYAIVLSGGEPFMWPHLFDICEKHNDVAFQVFTNGTHIDKSVTARIKELANITPSISMEGGREATDSRRGRGIFDQTILAMDYLKESGIIFGNSLTIHRKNCEEVLSDEFVRLLVEKGSLFAFCFLYIPIGSEPDISMMVTPEQRSYVVDRIRHLRVNWPLQMIDFWNDGHLTDGCIAAGRRYFHITAGGDVEPCAFVHFSVDNIRNKSLKEVLANPLFLAYQKRQAFSDNLLRPCPLIDVPEALREIVSESDARPTHKGCDSLIEGEISRSLDVAAREWQVLADKKWYAASSGSKEMESLIDILGSVNNIKSEEQDGFDFTNRDCRMKALGL